MGRICQPLVNLHLNVHRDPCVEAALEFLTSHGACFSFWSSVRANQSWQFCSNQEGTCCAALGSERALLHIGGSTVSRQKRKSILSAQHPSSQDPILLMKTRLLFLGCLLLSPALLVREMVSPLCSLSTKHCRASSQGRDGEVKAAVAMEMMHARSSAVPPVPHSFRSQATLQGLAFPTPFLKTPLHRVFIVPASALAGCGEVMAYGCVVLNHIALTVGSLVHP